MGFVSLGETIVTAVKSPEQCPAGTWASRPYLYSSQYGWGWHYLCMTGEPIYCELFGIGCKGVSVPPPPAPQTESQMRDPEQWTPDIVAEQWRMNQEQMRRDWLAATGGIGTALPGEEAEEAAKRFGLSLGIGLALAAGVAVLVLLKR